MTEATHKAQQRTTTPAYDDTAARENASLDSCTPASIPDASTDQGEGQIIRPAPRDEPFTRTGQSRDLVCYVHRKVDAQGFYTGEDYYPVLRTLQPKIRQRLRPITFHGCILHTGQSFIYPQKRDISGRRPNSWNTSLAEALGQSPGQWLKIWSDDIAQRYQFEPVSPLIEDVPEYPDFENDLEWAMKPNIIDRLDHPILLKAPQSNDAGDEKEVY
jgi:hypothetical protein